MVKKNEDRKFMDALQLTASIAALKLAIETIEGLADQQAMPDDWWQGNLAMVRRTMESLEKVKSESLPH